MERIELVQVSGFEARGDNNGATYFVIEYQEVIYRPSTNGTPLPDYTGRLVLCSAR